ncbi:hypothetical protein ES703_101460 [subsurface metagenome]
MLKYYPDEFGNRIPDYSYCGYKAGEVTIPSVPVKVIVPLKEGDATEYIQNAIDYVSSLPLNEKRFRGTILLEKGIYTLNGRLKIMASGIVLRGSGTGDKGTTIIASGTARETLIRISGENDREFEPELRLLDT